MVGSRASQIRSTSLAKAAANSMVKEECLESILPRSFACHSKT